MNSDTPRQTVLAFEADSKIIFARLPTQLELAQQQAMYDRNMEELEEMIPRWFMKPDGLQQSTMLDFCQAKKKNLGDKPNR